MHGGFFLTLVKLCKFAISNRLGGEISTSDVNMRKDYKMCQVFYTFFFNQFLLHVNEVLWSGQVHYTVLLSSLAIFYLITQEILSLFTYNFLFFSLVNGITVEP